MTTTDDDPFHDSSQEETVQSKPDGTASSDPTAMVDLTGRSLGNWRLLRRIGEGAFGWVYEGRHLHSRQRAAIKVLKPEAITAGHQVRFLSEIRALATLEHENIVQMFDSGVCADGTSYLVTEFLDGVTLRALLKKESRLAPLRTIQIALQITRALRAAHRHGIIHRDLKPDNIFLISRDENPEFVKLLDFGVARLLGGSGTRTGVVIGTYLYIAPEQWRGVAVLDGRSDIYSLGMVLYQMATGRRPFEAPSDNWQGWALHHVSTPPPDPSPYQVPPPLARLILQMLAKSPDERPQNADEVIQQLQAAAAWIQERPTPIAQPLPAAPPSPPAPGDASSSLESFPSSEFPSISQYRPRRLRTALSLIAAMALLIGASAILSRSRPWTSGATPERPGTGSSPIPLSKTPQPEAQAEPAPKKPAPSAPTASTASLPSPSTPSLQQGTPAPSPHPADSRLSPQTGRPARPSSSTQLPKRSSPLHPTSHHQGAKPREKDRVEPTKSALNSAVPQAPSPPRQEPLEPQRDPSLDTACDVFPAQPHGYRFLETASAERLRQAAKDRGCTPYEGRQYCCP